MKILYTNGATISATIPEFQAYTQIRYAPTDGETMVSLVVTTSEWIMLGGALGTQSAKVQFTGETHGWTGEGNDSLLGDAARQWLEAGGGNDSLYGFAGADVLTGGLGDDKLYGGDDSDELYDAGGANVLYGGAGRDYLVLGYDAAEATGQSSLYGGSGNDTLKVSSGFGGFDHLYGGAGWDVVQLDPLYSSANNILSAGFNPTGTLDFEVITGTLYGDNHSNVFDFSQVAADKLTVRGNGGNDLIRLLHGSGSLSGGAGDDTLYGGDLGSTLEGAEGHDEVHGGAGNDLFIVSLEDLLQDTLFGGGGQDALSLLATKAVIEGLDLASLGSWSKIYLGPGDYKGGAGNTLFDFSAVTETMSYMVRVFGGAGDDTLIGATILNPGGGGMQRLYGGDGNDSLVGGNDRDLLDGGAGADTMSGGKGGDAYVVDGDSDVVIETADGGDDQITVKAPLYHVIKNIEVFALRSDMNSTVFGDDASNHFLMLGSKGTDLLWLGAGDDWVDGSFNSGPKLVVHGDAGNDIINSRSRVSQLFGGTGNDTLVSTDVGRNQLYGGAGNDALWSVDDGYTPPGKPGNATLQGGAGVDSYYGGRGNDLFIMSTEDLAGNLEDRHGHDTVKANFVNWTMVAGIEDYIATAGQSVTITGNDEANKITTTRYDDTIFGGTDDTLAGGAGDDTYIFTGNNVNLIETAAGGYDTAYVSADSFVMGDNLELVRFVQKVTQDGLHATVTGNSRDNTIVVGGGLSGVDVDAGAGNDTLTVDGGVYIADSVRLTGGAGADTFAFINAAVSQMQATFVDFTPGEDLLQFPGLSLSLKAGPLPQSLFHVGPANAAGFHYDQSTGTLSYWFQFGTQFEDHVVAQFTNHAALTFHDFIVV